MVIPLDYESIDLYILLCITSKMKDIENSIDLIQCFSWNNLTSIMSPPLLGFSLA